MILGIPRQLDELINQGITTAAPGSMTFEMERLWNAYGQASRSMQSGDMQTAVESYEAIIKRWPTFVAAKVNIAQCLMTLGYPADALEHLSQAHALAPDDPDIHNVRARVYESIGDKGREIDERHIALEHSPDNPSLMNDLGATYREVGQFALAVTWLLRAKRRLDEIERESFLSAKHQIDELRGRVFWNLGSTYMDERKYAEAVSCWKELIASVPDGRFAPHAKDQLRISEEALRRQQGHI